MCHTGILLPHNKTGDRKWPHIFLPLSAALRVSQRAVDRGIIQYGSIHPTVVFSFDPMGDSGSPLLTYRSITQEDKCAIILISRQLESDNFQRITDLMW